MGICFNLYSYKHIAIKLMQSNILWSFMYLLSKLLISCYGDIHFDKCVFVRGRVINAGAGLRLSKGQI